MQKIFKLTKSILIKNETIYYENELPDWVEMNKLSNHSLNWLTALSKSRPKRNFVCNQTLTNELKNDFKTVNPDYKYVIITEVCRTLSIVNNILI